MSEIKWGPVNPEEMISEIEDTVKKYRENKYAFQIGLKNLDFEIDEDRIETLGITIPFRSIDQAEQALRSKAIKPGTFLEDDNTKHKVLAFNPKAVGFSGFMDCVTHSLALTDHGLFEVGRYPAISLSNPNRYWQWFLHRQLGTMEEVESTKELNQITNEQLLEGVYSTYTGLQTDEDGVA